MKDEYYYETEETVYDEFVDELADIYGDWAESEIDDFLEGND